MPNLPVTSREYKLMLNVDRFKERDEGVETFLTLIKFLVGETGIVKEADKTEKRITSFLDTAELALHQRGFALRRRQELEPKPGFQLNLKCRDSDRYVSAAKDVSAAGESKQKFEEDILPPFVSKFSNSNTVKIKETTPLGTVGEIARLFPGIKTLNLDENTVVAPVDGFRVIEIVRELCEIRFDDQEPVVSSMSFWYLEDSETEWPMIAEFSFAYKPLAIPVGDRLETFADGTVTGAGKLYRALQKHSGWLNLDGTTKTAFALDS